MLSVFAALAILFGAPAASPFGRDGSVAIRAAVAIQSGPALHAAQAFRLAFEPRGESRAPLPTCSAAIVNACVRGQDATRPLPSDPMGRPADAVASRGYDATAPPAST